MMPMVNYKVINFPKLCLGFPDSSVGKESTCNAGDPSSIPGSGRSARERKGYLLQYSGLENSMNYIVLGVAKSWTQLRDFHFTSLAGVWCSQITSFKDWHILLLSFWLCGKACEVLVSWSGIEPEPWQWKRQVLTTRPPGNSQQWHILKQYNLKHVNELHINEKSGFFLSCSWWFFLKLCNQCID